MQPFIAQRRHRTVARNKRHVIAQAAAVYRLIDGDQLTMVAAREVAAPYSAFENHVARNQQS